MSMFIPSLVSWIILISSHSPQQVQTPSNWGQKAKVVVVAAAAEAFAQLDLDGAQPFDSHFPAVFRRGNPGTGSPHWQLAKELLPSICEYGFVWELGISEKNCNFSTENDDQHPISGDVSAVKEPTSHSTIGWSVWKGKQTQGESVKCRICHSSPIQIIPKISPTLIWRWDRHEIVVGVVAWTGPPHWKIGGVSIPFLTCPGQKMGPLSGYVRNLMCFYIPQYTCGCLLVGGIGWLLIVILDHSPIPYV